MGWSENELDKMLVASDFAPLKEEREMLGFITKIKIIYPSR